MFYGKFLTLQQKEIVFNALKTIRQEQLHPLLVNAALQNLVFPSTMEGGALSALIIAYTECNHLNNVAMCVQEAIQTYMSSCGYQKFQILLRSPFIADHWRSPFLIYLTNQLDIALESNPPLTIIQETVSELSQISTGTQYTNVLATYYTPTLFRPPRAPIHPTAHEVILSNQLTRKE
jgi:hypothetical protein